MKKYKNPTIDSNGNKFWHQNNKRHRLDGPAIEHADGDKFWYQTDKLHRLNGPAIEYANGDKIWYKNGIEYFEEDYWLRAMLLQAKLEL